MKRRSHVYRDFGGSHHYRQEHCKIQQQDQPPTATSTHMTIKSILENKRQYEMFNIHDQLPKPSTQFTAQRAKTKIQHPTSMTPCHTNSTQKATCNAQHTNPKSNKTPNMRHPKKDRILTHGPQRLICSIQHVCDI